MMKITHPIEGSFQFIHGDFTHAGAASSELKAILLRLGVSEENTQRAAISAFEAEMNVIIHALAGTLHYAITVGEINIMVTDIGPGIKDIELAMREGYSTAPEWVRAMGWGAGMGLPNIKKNADRFKIDSVVGEGTTLEITIYL